MTRYGKTLTTIGVLALGAAATLAPAASLAKNQAKPIVKTIRVRDDFYSLGKLKIKRGNKINFVWAKANFDSHNVTLSKGPKGVKPAKFASATGTSGIKFERTFMTPGTYQFQCTIHPESMNLTVTVKR
jgi:plastocyanin